MISEAEGVGFGNETFEASGSPERNQSAAGGFGLSRETRRLGVSPGAGVAASSGAGAGLRAWAPGREAEPPCVQFQLAIDQPEVAVTAMQSFGVRLVAEPDGFDDVFQGEIDEADLAVFGLTQVLMIGICGVLDMIIQGRRDRDEIAFVIKPSIDHTLCKGDVRARPAAED